jgi:hypothetical protein
VQVEPHAWNPHCGEPSGRRRHCRDPKGPGANTSRSSAHDAPLILPPPSQALVDTIRNTTEELCSITAQYTASNEAVQLCPAPSNNREESSNVAIRDAGECTKGSKKRHKQRLQEAATAAYDDGGNDKLAGGSGVVCITTATSSGKRQARPPMNHSEKLLKEDCPNHSYPIKHKLWDCGMMKNFMASGSITRGMELDEGDVTPFPVEDTAMMIYDGCPSLGMHRVSNLSPRTPTCYSWEGGRDLRM